MEVMSAEELQQIFDKDLPSADCDTTFDLSEEEEDEELPGCLDLIASPSRGHSGLLQYVVLHCAFTSVEIFLCFRTVRFCPDRVGAGTPMRLTPEDESFPSWEDSGYTGDQSSPEAEGLYSLKAVKIP
jgi:hypothetical protein